MESKQRIEIIDGVKTAIVDGYDTGDRIYADTLNGICHEDLYVENYDIEKALPRDKYFLHAKIYGSNMYIPIRIKILYIINQAKNELELHRQEKKFINTNATNLKNNLVHAINHMKKIEKLYKINPLNEQDELLNILRIKDGNKKEREEAIKSYENILAHTQKILQHKHTRSDAKDTLIKTECINSISSILKNRGIKKHRVEAISLIRSNGLEIPNRF